MCAKKSDSGRWFDLLQELIFARGPVGQEDEVAAVCLPHLREVCDDVWTDSAGNLIGLIKGRQPAAAAKDLRPGQQPHAIRVLAHMDELSMEVKRVEEDGALRVEKLGGLHPCNFGQGPVEILGDKKMLNGVLSLGCMHTSEETAHVWKAKDLGGNKALRLDQMHVMTRLSAAELEAAGVHAGTRVVVAKERRKLWTLNDCWCGYFMDDRAAMTISLAAAAMLRAAKVKPAVDVYLVMTSAEEILAGPSAYASCQLPGDVSLALDVAPAEKEIGIELNANPVVVYRDFQATYTKSVCDRLRWCGEAAGVKTACAVFHNYGSDASYSGRVGCAARTTLLAIPTCNTHGYEVIHRDGIENCAKVLAEYLKQG